MRKKIAAAIVAGAAVAAGPGFGTVPAMASPAVTFTATPGGAFGATGSKITFKDGLISLTCTGSSASGGLRADPEVSGTAIGSISSLTYTGCTGPLGATTITVKGEPSINADSYGAGITAGTVSGISATISSAGCSFKVTGSVSSTFVNDSHTLSLIAGAGLTASSVTGCPGLVKNGDQPTFTAGYILNGDQTITSP